MTVVELCGGGFVLMEPTMVTCEIIGQGEHDIHEATLTLPDGESIKLYWQHEDEPSAEADVLKFGTHKTNSTERGEK